MILWSDWSLRQLEEIHAFYAEEANSQVADRIIASILQTTRLLEQYPNGGQLEPSLDHLGQGHRRIVVGQYKVIYQVVEEAIRIVDVFDSRQDPERMRP